MATTPKVTSIRYTIQAGNLLIEGTPTRAAIDRLAQMTADALAVAFPGAEITCPIEKTSGVRPAGYDRVRMADPEADDYDVRERVSYLANETWEKWAIGLTDADYEPAEGE